MALNFPNSPSNGDTVTLGGVVYTYQTSSTTWQAASSSTPALSVTTASASGSGSLAYNSGNGVLTFTPAVSSDSSADVNNLQKDLSHLALLRAVDQTAAAHN